MSRRGRREQDGENQKSNAMQHAHSPFCHACVGPPRQIAGLLTQTDAACTQILQASTKKTPEPE
jgi:hypothetical protein